MLTCSTWNETACTAAGTSSLGNLGLPAFRSPEMFVWPCVQHETFSAGSTFLSDLSLRRTSVSCRCTELPRLHSCSKLLLLGFADCERPCCPKDTAKHLLATAASLAHAACELTGFELASFGQEAYYHGMHLFGSHDDLPLGGYSRGLGAVPVPRPATGKTFMLSTFESFDDSDLTWFPHVLSVATIPLRSQIRNSTRSLESSGRLA
jgi:hypothetical protein